MFPVRCWIKSCRWLDWVSFFCVWLQPSKCHTTSVTSYYLCCSILFPQVLSRWLKSNKSKLTSFVWSFSTMFKGLVFSNPLTSSATFNAWAGPPPAELLQEMWAAPAVPPKGVQVWLRLRQPKEFQHFFHFPAWELPQKWAKTTFPHLKTHLTCPVTIFEDSSSLTLTCWSVAGSKWPGLCLECTWAWLSNSHPIDHSGRVSCYESSSLSTQRRECNVPNVARQRRKLRASGQMCSHAWHFLS